MSSKKFRLILASRSPRRLQILQSAGFVCTTCPSNSSESFDENLTIDENLCAISERKVEGALGNLSIRNLKGKIILAADTMVIVGNQALGKPKNRPDARRMLRLLSGKTHVVMTAFSLFCPDQGRGVTRLVKTKVGFRKLSKEDIEWYVFTSEPYDKAGGYAVQGLAQEFVCLIDGDVLNVVGLPLYELKQELRKNHWDVERRTKIPVRSRKSRRR